MSAKEWFLVGYVLGFIFGFLVPYLLWNRLLFRSKPEPEKPVDAEIVPDTKPEILVKPSTGETIVKPDAFKRDRKPPRYDQGFRDAAAAVRSSRPELYRAQVICAKCNEAVDMLSSTGMHVGKAPGGFDSNNDDDSKGFVMAQANCHGDFCDIVIPFSELRKNPRMNIRVFEEPGVRLVAPFGNCGIGGVKNALPNEKRKLTYL